MPEAKTFQDIAATFDERVRRIVWCTVSTVDTKGRPFSRILHPVWEGSTGWIATGRQTLKTQHLAKNPVVALSYWDAAQDTVIAQCHAEWCDDDATRRRWDKQLGLGRDKIFEVRRIHNDLTFIDEFLTLDFVRQHKLFRFGYNPTSESYEIESREFPKVKQQLLQSLTNRGRSLIAVVDGNYRNRGELYLKHDFSGVELQLEDAADTLQNLERLWSRPVHIETVLEGHKTVLSFDGTEHDIEKGEAVESAELEIPS
jgi:stage V sporulation protein R